jgi:hypothetical protein
MTKTELARTYLEKSLAGEIDALEPLLTDDVALNRPMLGVVSGKAAVLDAIRSRPAMAANFTPVFEEPRETGDQVQVKGNLPPGSPFPVSSLTWTFSFAGDAISRIDVGL